MYDHILVAIDGSETSNLALKEAIKLAKSEDSTLRLVHVVDVSLTYTDLGAPYVLDYQEAIRAAARKVIADCAVLAQEAAIKFGTKSIEIDALGRHVHDAIEEEAQRWPADLIVIGTHGRRGVRRWLLGSVAEGLVRIASKPVLLVRAP